jgi:hypothetical protein
VSVATVMSIRLPRFEEAPAPFPGPSGSGGHRRGLDFLRRAELLRRRPDKLRSRTADDQNG